MTAKWKSEKLVFMHALFMDSFTLTNDHHHVIDPISGWMFCNERNHNMYKVSYLTKYIFDILLSFESLYILVTDFKFLQNYALLLIFWLRYISRHSLMYTLFFIRTSKFCRSSLLLIFWLL